jgi:flavin-dependent dehydrogenase
MTFTNTITYDIAICGAGLAGLTLARQLKRKIPNISIVFLDQLARPLPEATFKVGESTVSVGTYYIANILELEDYLNKYHLPKLGVRFFLGNSHLPFEARSEFGQSEFFGRSYPYQLDRGRLENDLRAFNTEAGVELLENCLVKEIKLSETPKNSHKIVYRQGGEKTNTIQARWVIDAMGRRRFLQKKLGLAKPNNPKYSAAWFRIEGSVDVSNFVSSSQKQWHDRVPNNNRYYSTNNLCGEGYWVWLIALSSGYTSIGIVTDEETHPFGEYNTYQRAYQWLEKHEPILAFHLKGKQPSDFMKMPRYSYSSKQVFSLNRWACVGEAGVFAEPLNSSGLQLIALGNSLTTQLIELDLEGKLISQDIDEANCLFIAFNDRMAQRIQNYYVCFRNEVATALKYVWDVMITWAFSSPMMFNGVVFDEQKRAILSQSYDRFALLENRVQQLFIEWSKKSLRRVTYDYIDYGKIAFMKQHRSRNFSPKTTDWELIESQNINLEVFEELAQAIFLIAVADTMPEQLNQVVSTGWLNAWAISLEPNRWENDGIFQPRSQPRTLHRVMEPLRQMLQIPDPIFEVFSQNLDDSPLSVERPFSETCSNLPVSLKP